MMEWTKDKDDVNMERKCVSDVLVRSDSLLRCLLLCIVPNLVRTR